MQSVYQSLNGMLHIPHELFTDYLQPFLQKYPKNSSWEIASTLPALIPASEDNPTPIHIHVHHEAVRVAYNHVVNLIPRLLPPANPMHPKPDIILHIGLAAGRPFYTLERGAHGRGFGAIPDVDGERFPDDVAEGRFPRDIFPTILHTSFDTDDVVARWRENLEYASANTQQEGPLDVRLSPDAGNFLCGFTYYNSLAHYYHMSEDERPVAFLHVPDLSGSIEQLVNGRGVTIALIKALVESRRQVGVVDALEKVSSKEQGAVADTDVNFA